MKIRATHFFDLATRSQPSFLRRSCLSIIALASSVFVLGSACVAPVCALQVGADKIAPAFEGYTGCFVLFDVEKNQFSKFNPARCAEQLPPCSTFKVFNSLAGLDAGVLSGPDHLMKWDGQKRFVEAWNQDLTLRMAVKESAVWYFQNVARLIGEERMKKYLAAVGYGNQDMSAGLTEFWLGKSLKISANEQVQFLHKLYLDELPFSKVAQKTVKEIIVVGASPRGTLRGKTGSDYADGKWILGWFVGYVTHDDKPYIFATNISASDGAKGAKAREITERILKEAGLY